LTPTRLVLLAALLAACGSSDQGTTEGLVVDVQGDLSAVTEFSLLTQEGTEVFIPAEDGDFAFPLPHLREHIISGVPVVVFWEDRDGRKVAVFVDDAEQSPH
jgi:hypothetical protein